MSKGYFIVFVRLGQPREPLFEHYCPWYEAGPLVKATIDATCSAIDNGGAKCWGCGKTITTYDNHTAFGVELVDENWKWRGWSALGRAARNARG